MAIIQIRNDNSFWLVPLLYGLRRVYLWFTTDYQAFLDLGKGGTPANLWGWWRIKRLSLFKVPSVLEAPMSLLTSNHTAASSSPSQPVVAPVLALGRSPQRQTDQKAPRSTFTALEKLITSFAKAYPKEVYLKESFLEGHTIGLRGHATALSSLRAETQTFGYEICHPHRSDGSMHFVMHPEDIQTVIDAGWGERHPLARADWWWLLYFKLRGIRPPVPETLVFVYAPRSNAEMEVIKEIMMAAAWWITGVEFGNDEEKEEEEEKFVDCEAK